MDDSAWPICSTLLLNLGGCAVGNSKWRGLYTCSILWPALIVYVSLASDSSAFAELPSRVPAAQVPDDDAPSESIEKGVDASSVKRASARSHASQPIGGSIWQAQGPGPTLNGQVENVAPGNEVVGAVHTVAAHPTDPNVLYLGAVNGGIWKSTNATALSPTWIPLTDQMPSMSIGALEFDPTDVMHQTLVAGAGRFSSFGGAGGARVGLMRTTNGGASWALLDGGGALVGKNISGVAVRGSTIVIAVNFSVPFTFGNVGLFRSVDGGASFAQVSGAIGGPPQGRCFDLVGHRNTPNVLYASIRDAGSGNGIYKSVDTGASWSRVSNGSMNGRIFDGSGGTSNVEMAIHDNAGAGTNAVYVAILNAGQLRNGGVFRSTNGGSTWVQMDTPTTNEGGVDVGTNPRYKRDAGNPSGQGAIHFSIVADPFDVNVVYVGGDRQPLEFQFPNSIGAIDFTGRLFRGNAAAGFGNQWVHLTHSNTIGAAGGGTANASAPHADSREMVFDAAGRIIEVDDGGVYRQSSPQNNVGDWFSIIGNLQTTEFHDIAYDSNANVIIGGAQDTGTPQQVVPGGARWDSVSTADGGDVAVDDSSSPGISTRYSSFQFLGNFRRRDYDSTNGLVAEVFPALAIVGGGTPLVTGGTGNSQFVTPLALNAVDQTHLIIGGESSVYESLDRGDTVREIGPGIVANRQAMVYGGRLGGVADDSVVYVGDGTTIYMRSLSQPVLLPTATAFPGNFIRDLAIDPDDWTHLYVADSSDRVYRTTDAGLTWQNVTGDLPPTGNTRVIFYVSWPLGVDAIVVGTGAGVYVSLLTSPGQWQLVGTNLPNVPVYDMDYDQADDVLVVGTLGRGAWLVSGFTAQVLPDCNAEVCLGACCLSDTCQDGVTINDCLMLGGVFSVGEVCATTCLGSCCIGSMCLGDVTAGVCSSGGGVFTEGGDCNSVPCGGACCQSLSCDDDVAQSSCQAVGANWHGGRACDDVCLGACCRAGACIPSVTDFDCRQNLSGEFSLATACIDVFCACSNGIGACDRSHGNAGCDDGGCCQAVCDIDPNCCDANRNAWDSLCVTQALAVCALNDECTAARTIVEGVTAFDTSLTQTSGPADCLSGDQSVGKNDLWYVHHAQCSGDLTVSLCTNTSYDNTLQIYDTTACNPLGMQLGCGDDSCGLSSGPARLTVPVTLGDALSLRVGGFASARGAGEIDVSCAGARLIAPGPAMSPHDVSKDRYISFDPSVNGNTMVGYRVTRIGDASSWYVDCATLADLGAEGVIGSLTRMPMFCDWSSVTASPFEVLHVRGCILVPGNEYLVEATIDGVTLSSPLVVVTTPPQFTAGREFGDLVGGFIRGGAWTMPDGLVTASDIVAVVAHFEQQNSVPHISRVDTGGQIPDTIVDINDIFRVVSGFAGAEFGFNVTGCLAGKCVPDCP